MYFKNPEELVEFFNKLDLERSTLVMLSEGKKKKPKCECVGECACEVETEEEEDAKTESVSTTPESIIVESLSGDPSFSLSLVEEGDNVFYVKDYDVSLLEEGNSDGTGKIVLEDRTSHLNMSSEDNVATVDLTVVVDSVRISTIPFKLVKTDEAPHIILNKAHLP